MLQHFNNSSTHNDAQTSGAVNFVGTITCTSSINFDKLSCGCFKERADLWILDSGASHHMTFNRKHLINILLLPYPLLVRLPNGYNVKVIEVGNMVLSPKITLYKVWLIPSFKYNLISISSLTSHLKGIILFSDITCLLQAPSLKRPLVIGNMHEGLYLLCSECLRKRNNIYESESYFSNSILSPKYDLVNKIHCSCHSLSYSWHPSIVNNMIHNNKSIFHLFHTVVHIIKIMWICFGITDLVMCHL